MTYSLAGTLQAALYARLSSSETLRAIVGDAIYDGLPPGDVPPIFVSLGEERVSDRSDFLERAAYHDFEIAVVTEEAGFARAKDAAGAISDVLLGAPLALERGQIIGLWFRQARARRMRRSGTRRIDLGFRVHLYDSL